MPQACLQARRTRARSRPTRKHARRLTGPVLAQGARPCHKHARKLAILQDPCSLKTNPQACLQAYRTRAHVRTCHKRARKPVCRVHTREPCSRKAMPQACPQVRGILIQRLG
ncbi:hypothetical protein NE237_004342 [Protea cynaroides]|uniref:Uncharacterized protein n=1 Tax=Protea cynaroides TaxID=273540 RepID=A0A9Q0KIG6_9MAGN|nr:hypothetical protein NE237_004342 [Protea cynaroides]